MEDYATYYSFDHEILRMSIPLQLLPVINDFFKDWYMYFLFYIFTNFGYE